VDGSSKCPPWRGVALTIRAPIRYGLSPGRTVQTSQEMNARARITAPARRSTPRVTLRKVGRPYHKTGENPRIVTLRCNSTSVLKYICTIIRLYYIKKCNEMLRNVAIVRLYYYAPMRIEAYCKCLSIATRTRIIISENENHSY
jgi:hypothetical protein